MRIDFGRTAHDYARFRAGFPDELFVRLDERGIGRSGQRILDLGTGTGSLARGFLRRGAAVIALDISSDMLGAARRLGAAEGLVLTALCARAEATGLAADSVDVVSAGQCWHWFDGAAAAREARRVLRQGGRLSICHFDWVPLPGNVVEATERLIARHNPAWGLGGGSHLHHACLADVALAGFDGIETFSFDQPVSYSHAAWRGRIRASAGVGASLPADAVARFDADLAALLAERFPNDPLRVPHRVFAALAQAP